jgi:hypothetical protein
LSLPDAATFYAGGEKDYLDYAKFDAGKSKKVC